MSDLADSLDQADDSSPISRRTGESPDHHALFLRFARLPPATRARTRPWVEIVDDMETDLAWQTIKTLASRNEWRARLSEQEAIELIEVRERTVRTMARAVSQTASALHGLSATLNRAAQHYLTVEPESMELKDVIALARVVASSTAPWLAGEDEVRRIQLDVRRSQVEPLTEAPGAQAVRNLLSHENADEILAAIEDAYPDNNSFVESEVGDSEGGDRCRLQSAADSVH